MKNLLILPLLTLFLSVSIFAQNNSLQKKHEFKGVIKTQNSEVIAGEVLYFKKDNQTKKITAVTDIDGRFTTELTAGKYELTLYNNMFDKFKAFINIQDDGLNPNNVVLYVKTNENICGLEKTEICPKPIKFPKLVYPATALITRTSGEVMVDISIDKDGKVISAKAISGHPLLRDSSANMAKQIIYEPSKENRDNIIVTFVYINDTPNKNLTIYKNPYRILVIEEREVIQVTSH